VYKGRLLESFTFPKKKHINFGRLNKSFRHGGRSRYIKDMAKTARQNVGALGEDIAAKFLVNKGYSFVERNYRKPWGELDLVMIKDKKLVFVEVKSVSHETNLNIYDQSRPEDNVHRAKIERLSRAIATYLSEKGKESTDWQLDLVTVHIDFEKRIGKCGHLENIF
jgi:putative endonuclease